MPMSHMTFAQKAMRLSPMYLVYFTLFGVFVPYIARFLTENGLSAREASVIVAIVNGVNLFAPFMFSYLADRSGQRMRFIRAGYLAIGFFYCLSLFGSGFWFYLTVFGLFGVFLSAVLPQMESVTLHVLGKEKARYGQIRLWGSLGFVVVVWIVGALLDKFSVNILPVIGVVLSLLMFASTFLVPEQPRANANVNETSTTNLAVPMSKLPWGQISVLLSVVLFWQFSMAPYNTFFDLYLREQGFSASTNGFLISFGALAEVAVFVAVAALFRRYSERFLIVAALGLTVGRWLLLYAFADSFWLVLFTQSLHAATFGVVHSVAVHRIGRLFPERRASFGQGLYVALGMGLGLLVGNLLAGILWDGSGLVFLQAAGWSLLALLIALFGFREPLEPVEADHS